MHKTFDISAETFAKSYAYAIKVNNKDHKSVLWIRIFDIQKTLDVKNIYDIYDLVDKEIKGKFKANNPTEQQIKKYKRNASELLSN